MAKVIAPLLSFGATGQIGKAVVFGDWRGVPYARQYVKPANPQTTKQQANRTRFALLREMWKLSPSTVRDPFNAFATGRTFLGFNAFVGENNRLLVGQTGLESAIMSPGARGGLPPVAVTAATGAAAGEINVTVTLPPDLPDGWTIESISAAAVIDQDPTGIFSGPFIGANSVTTGSAITLTGMTTGATCVAFGWIVYTKPNGDTAYSVSLSDLVIAG